MLHLAQVEIEDLAPPVVRRGTNAELAVEAAWPQQRLVQYRHQVGGGDGQHWRLVGLALAHAEHAQDLVLEAVLRQRVHLVQQFVERAAAAAHHHAAEAARVTRTRARLTDGVDLVDEQDARAVLAGQLAGFVVQAEHAQRVHAPEHALDTRRRHVTERQLRLGGDRLTEVALARAWRSFEEETADRLAAHQLEALDALQQGDHLAGGFQHLGVALVILEADTCLTRHQPVDARPPDEPEQHDELEDHQEGHVEQLEDQIQAGGDEWPDALPLRQDHEQADERQHADDEQRSDQHADAPEGAIDLAVELVVLVHSEIHFERTI